MPRRRLVRKAIEKKLQRAIQLSARTERALARAAKKIEETEARFSRLMQAV
jgi:hypothetical protein